MSDRVALREAIESAIHACDWAGREMLDSAGDEDHPGLRAHDFKRCDEYTKAAATLRAWLDSGLSDAEREAVSDALRPIAEGKR